MTVTLQLSLRGRSEAKAEAIQSFLRGSWIASAARPRFRGDKPPRKTRRE
jgi:hypothetical protein